MPLYHHPVLRPIGEPERNWDNPEAGSVTDRDDYIFLEDMKMVTNSNWHDLLDDAFTVISRSPSSISDKGSKFNISSDSPSEGNMNIDPDTMELNTLSVLSLNISEYISECEAENEVKMDLKHCIVF
jgi:hypothetical protein